MPQSAHCSLLHRFVFLYLSAFVHHTPGSGNKAGVCRLSTLTGSLTPPTIYRFPLFAWDAFNARTETGEAYHYTHPVSSRSAGCPLLDPSDCLAHLAGHGVSSDGALLLQSRIKNVQMLKVSATALLCIQFPKFLHPELSVFVFGCLLQFSVTSVPLVCPYNSRFEIRFVDCARPIAIGLTQTVFMGFSVLPQGSSYPSDQEPCSILQRLIPPCSRGSQDKLHRLGRPFSADRQTYG